MISRAVIDQLLLDINITDIVSKYVTLEPTGNNLNGLCPFHEETRPSFMVSSEKQIYKCFNCKKGGNVIKFLMDIEQISFPDAIAALQPHLSEKHE